MKKKIDTFNKDYLNLNKFEKELIVIEKKIKKEENSINLFNLKKKKRRIKE